MHEDVAPYTYKVRAGKVVISDEQGAFPPYYLWQWERVGFTSSARLVSDGDWLVIPRGVRVRFDDTSWYARGTPCIVAGPARYRLIGAGSARALSTYEIQEYR